MRKMPAEIVVCPPDITPNAFHKSETSSFSSEAPGLPLTITRMFSSGRWCIGWELRRADGKSPERVFRFKVYWHTEEDSKLEYFLARYGGTEVKGLSDVQVAWELLDKIRPNLYRFFTRKGGDNERR